MVNSISKVHYDGLIEKTYIRLMSRPKLKPAISKALSFFRNHFYELALFFRRLSHFLVYRRWETDYSLAKHLISHRKAHPAIISEEQKKMDDLFEAIIGGIKREKLKQKLRSEYQSSIPIINGELTHPSEPPPVLPIDTVTSASYFFDFRSINREQAEEIRKKIITIRNKPGQLVTEDDKNYLNSCKKAFFNAYQEAIKSEIKLLQKVGASLLSNEVSYNKDRGILSLSRADFEMGKRLLSGAYPILTQLSLLGSDEEAMLSHLMLLIFAKENEEIPLPKRSCVFQIAGTKTDTVSNQLNYSYFEKFFLNGKTVDQKVYKEFATQFAKDFKRDLNIYLKKLYRVSDGDPFPIDEMRGAFIAEILKNPSEIGKKLEKKSNTYFHQQFKQSFGEGVESLRALFQGSTNDETILKEIERIIKGTELSPDERKTLSKEEAEEIEHLFQMKVLELLFCFNQTFTVSLTEAIRDYGERLSLNGEIPQEFIVKGRVFTLKGNAFSDIALYLPVDWRWDIERSPDAAMGAELNLKGFNDEKSLESVCLGINFQVDWKISSQVLDQIAPLRPIQRGAPPK